MTNSDEYGSDQVDMEAHERVFEKSLENLQLKLRDAQGLKDFFQTPCGSRIMENVKELKQQATAEFCNLDITDQSLLVDGKINLRAAQMVEGLFADVLEDGNTAAEELKTRD